VAGVLLASIPLSGCEVLVVPVAEIAVQAAIVGADASGRASYASARQSAVETGIASRTLEYPLLVVTAEALPRVVKIRGWKIVDGNLRSCAEPVVISNDSVPSGGKPAVSVRVKCFAVGGPFPSSIYPAPSTVVVMSTVGSGDDDGARRFAAEILDELEMYFADVKPQTAGEVFHYDMSAVRGGIASLATGWTRKVDITERDAAPNVYRVDFRSPVASGWVQMTVTLTADDSNTTVTVVGNGKRSEPEFRSDAVMFFYELSTALAR
jgi:hypothetical protein